MLAYRELLIYRRDYALIFPFGLTVSVAASPHQFQLHYKYVILPPVIPGNVSLWIDRSSVSPASPLKRRRR